MARSRSRAACAAGLLLGLALGAAAAPLDVHIQLCTSCHGPGGNSVIPDNPKLAGADPGYLLRQLKHFKGGQRKHVIMSQIVLTVDEESFEGLAEYFGEQKRLPGTVTDPALAAKGKSIFHNGIVETAVPACSSCHGEDGSGDAKYPRLASQHATYVERQLHAFKSGERDNDAKGVMSAVAKRLSEADIRAAAQYVSGLKED
jgi:cytochrome c553